MDVQNTFCIPDFELFVAGRSGSGAVDDNRRLCEFIYRNLGTITQVFPSLDTHHAMQIFHAIWLVDEQGEHPSPYTLISAEDVAAGRWRVNPAVAAALGIELDYAERHLAPLHARGSPRAASTTSRSGPTTRSSVASATRWSRPSRRRSSSTA